MLYLVLFVSNILSLFVELKYDQLKVYLIDQVLFDNKRQRGGNLAGILELRPILIRICILFSHFTCKSIISYVLITVSKENVIKPINAVFHLFGIFINVVDPEDINI